MTLAKHKVPEPHIKVKDAAAYFVNTPGASLAGAAKYCGVSVPRMRELLRMPHNLAHVKHVRDLAVEALAASCPAALGKVIQENSNQMATVAAAKTVLAQARESEERGRAAAATRNSPGLIICIGAAVTVDPTPRLAGARTVEPIAYERGPDLDADLVDNIVEEDEALDALPEPARVVTK